MKKTTLMLSAIALTISSSIQAHEATLENVARDFADQPTKETDWYMSRLQRRSQLTHSNTIGFLQIKIINS